MSSRISLKRSTLFVALVAVAIGSSFATLIVLNRDPVSEAGRPRNNDDQNLPVAGEKSRAAAEVEASEADYGDFTGKEWVAFARRDVVSALEAAVKKSGGKIESLGDPVFLVLRNVTLEDAPGVIMYLNSLSADFKPGQLAHALSATAMKKEPLQDRIRLASLFESESLFEPFLRGVLNSSTLGIEGMPEMTLLARQSRFPELAEKLYGEKIVTGSSPDLLPRILDGLLEASPGDPDVLRAAVVQTKNNQTEAVGRWVMAQAGFGLDKYGRLAEDTLTKWALSDPNAAAAFLNEAPESPLTDAAISGLVRVLNDRDPAAAEAWSIKIKSTEWRERADTLKAMERN